MMRKHFHITLFFLFLLAGVSSLHAQKKKIIDSLQGQLAKEQPDTQRVNILNLLASQYRFTDHAQHKYYADQAITLSKKTGYTKGMAGAYNMMGLACENEGRYTAALAYYDSSLTAWKTVGDKSFEAKMLLNIANVYNEKADYKSAIDYTLRSQKAQQDLGSVFGVAVCKLTLGNIYYGEGDSKAALTSYEEAWKMNRASDKNPELEAATLGNIAGMFNDMGQYDSAMYYYRISLDYFLNGGFTSRLGSCYNNIGTVWEHLGHTDSAFYYHRKGLALHLQMSNTEGAASSLISLGDLFRKTGDPDSALVYYNNALVISKNIGTRDNELEVYYQLSQVYKQKKDFEKALSYSERYIGLYDSIHGQEQTRAIEKLRNNYLLDQKDAEIKTAEALRKLSDETNRRNFILFLSLSLIGLLLTGIVFQRYRTKQKHNRQLSLKNDEISTQKKEITDSIDYAKKIQEAILPDHAGVRQLFPGSFVLWRPRDIVSGDFMWYRRSGERIYLACADCTGHGVPGALVSIVGVNLLNETLDNSPSITTGNFLDRLHLRMVQSMNKDVTNRERKDGMDISLLCFDLSKNEVEFSGASRPFYFNDGTGLQQLRGDKFSIGGAKEIDGASSFATTQLPLKKGSSFYLFSDGFADQFGESTNKKFMTKRFFDLISSMQNETMEQQCALIEKAFLEWKGHQEQVDDVLVIGVRI
ncbi:MAG TPA: tetratricopeptide repeat protein [Bacteroidia bacterium]|nr:tetratricopeptide repeat protein [Bacteroidia bacterium]